MSEVASQSGGPVWPRSLFGDDGSCRSIVTGRRGRGATAIREHVVRLPAPSIAGRYELRFRYRPLKAWAPALLERVERAVAYYFQRVGGFRIADDAVMKHWVQLFADYGADELRWAIDAKAASLKGDTRDETREKRQLFTPRAENFQPGLWLERSPEYQHRQAALAKRANADRLDQVAISVGPATVEPVNVGADLVGPVSNRSSADLVGPVSNRSMEHPLSVGDLSRPLSAGDASPSSAGPPRPAAAPVPPERSLLALARQHAQSRDASVSAGGPVPNRSPVSDLYAACPPFIRTAIAEHRRVTIFLGQLPARVLREAGARLRRDRHDYKIWFDTLDDAPDDRDAFGRKCLYEYLLAQAILAMHPSYRAAYAMVI